MKTTEYIKREVVLNAIGDLFTICSHTLPNELGHHYVVEEEIEIFYNYVKDIPASDVKPIIYAEWVLINNPNYSPFDRSEECVYQCTNCKTIQDYRTLFCSHCGADMRSSKI